MHEQKVSKQIKLNDYTFYKFSKHSSSVYIVLISSKIWFHEKEKYLDWSRKVMMTQRFHCR